MNKFSENIYLPGGLHQFNHLNSNINPSVKDILIIGSNSEKIGLKFLKSGCNTLNIIVDDQDSLLISRLILKDFSSVRNRMMNYESTDFNNDQFDIVYAQASVSSPERNKIVKEIKRILKPGGIFSIGEITSLREPAAQFIKDIWDNGNIFPLDHNNVSAYYLERGFDPIDELDLSDRLNEFYNMGKELLKKEKDSLTPIEKSSYKKLLNRISHESNAYLKLGGKNYMGFKSLVLRKKI